MVATNVVIIITIISKSSTVGMFSPLPNHHGTWKRFPTIVVWGRE